MIKIARLLPINSFCNNVAKQVALAARVRACLQGVGDPGLVG